MAKKRGRPRGRKAGVPETVGAALGTVMAKVDAWVAQRQVLATELQQVIGRAQNMLASLGPVTLLRSGKRGRPKQLPEGVGPVHEVSSPGRPRARKRRAMSAEAREKIAAAQRARWARQKAAGGGTPSKSAKKGKRGRKSKAEAANS